MSIVSVLLGWTNWNASGEKERRRLKRRRISLETNLRLVEMVQPDHWTVTEMETAGGDLLAGI